MNDITQERIERHARSDATFDGRPFDGLPRADKDRYVARAKAGLEANCPSPSAIDSARAENEALIDEISMVLRAISIDRRKHGPIATKALHLLHLIASIRARGTPAPAETDKGWRTIESAPKDGTRFEAIYWWPAVDYTTNAFSKTLGRWSEPTVYAFATNPSDEQCFHSMPRGTCIRTHYTDLHRWRWRLLDLPASPSNPSEGA